MIVLARRNEVVNSIEALLYDPSLVYKGTRSRKLKISSVNFNLALIYFITLKIKY